MFDFILLSSIFKNLLFSILFLVAIFLAFYLPGRFILGRYYASLNIFSRTIVSISIGMVLWAYQGVILGYLGMRYVSYIYLLFFFILWFRSKPYFPKLHKQNINKKNLLLIAIFAVGIFGQISQFIVTAFKTATGIYSNMSASNDALLHTAYMIQLIKRFPPFEPGMTGVLVQNYHYWDDLVTGELIRVFHLPLFPTQFLYMSILISLLFGGAAYSIAKVLNFSFASTLILVYLQYFSSDLIYLLALITTHNFDFTTHPLMDGTMFLENPPRAFSFVVTLTGLVIFTLWFKYRSMRLGIISILLFASVVMFKVNTGFLIFGGVTFLCLYLILKKEWIMFFTCLLIYCVGFLIYFPTNSHAGLLIFDPFNLTRMFAVQPKLGLSHFELAREIYFLHHNIFGQLRMDFIMLILFLLGQFGIVNSGWIISKKMTKHFPKELLILIYGGILTELIVGSIYLQPIGLTNSFNFYLALSLFLSIPAAFIIGNFFSKKYMYLNLCILAILLFCTVPRWIYETNSKVIMLTSRLSSHTALVDTVELQAMERLKSMTSDKDIILVFNLGTWDSDHPYVSVFSQREMFLSGQVDELEAHGINFASRQQIVNTIQSSKVSNQIKNLLRKNKITILYFFWTYNLKVHAHDLNLERLYQVKQISFYRFKG